MDLADALSEEAGGACPESRQPTNSPWPGQPDQPTWPGAQPNQPTWPGAQPNQPTWPGAQPNQPTWPGAQPNQPTWPGAQPNQPTWPGAQPNQPSAPGGWPSGPGPAIGPGPGPGPGPVFPVAPQQNLSVPFTYDFPSGLHENMLITICGTINPKPNMFIVDFLASSDLVFHFNARFNEAGRQVIVRNSELGKKWGKEERDHPRFPFIPGKPFEIKILVTRSSFKVAVDNQHLLEFNHRYQNLKAVNRMSIFHDITLSKVNVENLQ